ncbi:tyrosine-type recombinase/integrase [Fundidesulfovibrio putealis]|uniref:tyrosine-type recombinase/integrase n=1 Tax=Fundidesulfovibrio putealis TaxID=270496 RepID=UPI000A039858|nr:site-specific integrase [Fundidesulfovibrio putealis]
MASISSAWALYAKLVLSTASTHSIATETGRWNNHILKHFDPDCEIESITSMNLLEFRSSLIGKKLSPQSISHCLSLFRRVLQRAKQWKLISGELPSFDMPRFDNKRIRFLTKEEANELLLCVSLKSSLWHDICVLALHTGLRSGELFKLRPCHFDSQNSALHVLDTKSNSNRTVPLNKQALEVLSRNISRKELIFTEHGKQILYAGRTFRQAVEICRLNSHTQDRRQRVVFHTLRHTFASWLVQSGIPLAVVGQLLGHKSMQMTMRYAHLAPAQGVSAVKALEQFTNSVNLE